MKERPILFSGPMVKAILDGRKTQTRRVVKLTSELRRRGCSSLEKAWVDRGFGDGQYLKVPGPDDTSHRLYCPYGYTGDRLWVREKAKLRAVCHGVWVDLVYAADDAMVEHQHKDGRAYSCLRWKPSIHMPRWASRILLEVTGVRVERVKDISHDDAVAEGCYRIEPCEAYPHGNAWGRAGYAALWDSINAKRGFGWDKNPWVWVVEFKRIG